MASLKRRAQRIVRKVARVGSVALPIAGALIGGPAGAAIGGAAGAALSQVGTGPNKRAQLRRSLSVTGLSVGVSGAASLLAGGGLTSGLVSNVSGLFGGSRTTNASGLSPDSFRLDGSAGDGGGLSASNFRLDGTPDGSAGGGLSADAISQLLGGGTDQSGGPAAQTPAISIPDGYYSDAQTATASASGGSHTWLLLAAAGVGLYLISRKK